MIHDNGELKSLEIAAPLSDGHYDRQTLLFDRGIIFFSFLQPAADVGDYSFRSIHLLSQYCSQSDVTRIRLDHESLVKVWAGQGGVARETLFKCVEGSLFFGIPAPLNALL